MLYAVNLWFKPIYTGESDEVNRGSLGTAKRLGRVQRLAAINITGALRTTATDAAEAHAKLIPIAQHAQTLCHKVVLRLAAHPSTHPLHSLIRWAAKCDVKHHRSSLHNLTHSFQLDPTKIETVTPACRAPTSTTPYTTHIADDKNKSIHEHDNIKTGTKVYSDGSGKKGKIGASAVLYRTGCDPRILCYHLGTEKEHTVYEAEAIGMSLAAQLLLTERELELPINIFVDNQAAIKSGDVSISKPGYYLIEHFSRLIRAIRKKHQCTSEDITVRWVTGHKDIEGNEKADVEAKKAADNIRNTSARKRLPHFLREDRLPLSILALLQNQKKIETNRWQRSWASSPRYSHLSKIDCKLLTGSFLQLTTSLTRKQSALLIWLRTKHAPLNAHLHRIK